MAEKKQDKIEREYVIPLREKCRSVPRYKKTPKAIKSIIEFIARHMKVKDRDLKKVKIDSYLNEQVWMRGIKKPLHKVKVKVVKIGDVVNVYAVDLPNKIKFKQKRLEKREVKAKAQFEEQKSMMEKAKESMQGKKEDKLEKEIEESGVDKKTAEKEAELDVKETEKVEEKKKEEKKEVPKEELEEKKASVEESSKKENKEEAKAKKHTTSTKETGEPKERVVEK